MDLFDPSHGMREEIPSIEALIERTSGNAFWLAVEEESAYAYWIWFPPFSSDELERRWQAVGPAGSLTDWHGVLGGDWIGAHCYLGDTDDPSSDLARFFSLFEQRIDTRRWPRPFICCDEHSSLWMPNGRILVHAGFSGSATAAEHPIHAEDFRRRRGL